MLVFIHVVAGVLFLALLNRLMLKIELQSPAPGKLVCTEHGRIHILEVGQGDRCIIMLPGIGTNVPSADFLPFAKELSSKGFKCLIVEPLGYGFSDDTDASREVDTVVSELHEAIVKYGTVRKYILLGHSASGFTIRRWQYRYPDEVVGLVGEDISLPEQFGVPEYAKMTPLKGPIRVLYTVSLFFGMLGVNRLLCNFNSRLLYAADGNKQLLHDYKRAFNKNRGSRAVWGEYKTIESNGKIVANFDPPSCTVLLFTACGKGSCEQLPNSVGFSWIREHEKFAHLCKYGMNFTIDGPHYLHYEHASEMSDMISKKMFKSETVL